MKLMNRILPIIIPFLVFEFHSISSYCQTDTLIIKYGWNNPCDPEFIFDYRMIYSDYDTEIGVFIEDKMDERYSIYVHYFMGDFENPNDLLVGLTHPNFEYEEVITKLCLAEEYYQKGLLHEKVLHYSKEAWSRFLEQ